MNRCKTSLYALIFIALGAVGVPGAAQDVAAVQEQNEAAAGGRTFPIGTLRGQFMVLNPPEIQLDGQAERLAPGAQIRSAQRMLVTPAAIVGQNLLVNYTRDAAGLVRQVWILTPEEGRAERASADRPMFNFWPFAASSGPRDDGKTPFDQLPKYGQ